MKAAVDYIRKGWTQFKLARTINGAPCDPRSDLAATWCIEGALLAAYGGEPTFHTARRRLYRVTRTRNLPVWNDKRTRTKRQVIEAMEKAGV